MADSRGALRVTDAVVQGRHGGVPIRTYAGQDASGIPLVWLHGGAFAYGSLDMGEADGVARALAAAGRTVLSVDYRRVPAFGRWRRPARGPLPGVRHPVPLDDVVDAVAAIGGPVLLGGASAGAALAATAALRLRDAEDSPVQALLLAYGTFHAALPPATRGLRRRLRGRHALGQFTRGAVLRMNRNYAGSAAAMTEPYAFAGGKDLTGLPPTLLLDADRDALRASGDSFAAELAAAGVPMRQEVVQEARHGFLDHPGTPHFDTGMALLLAFVRDLPG